MAHLLIFGGGEAAELAHFYFSHDTTHEVVAFCVDAGHLRESTFCGLPMLAFEEAVRRFAPENHLGFVAIGYRRLNRVRAAKCAAMTAAGYKLASYISSRATTFPGLVVGENCMVMENVTLQPFVRIGRHVTIWSGAHIAHHSIVEDDVFLAPRVAVAGRSVIGSGTFIGINATVRDHVRIGANSVIGAGAVVLADLPEGSLVTATAPEVRPVSRERFE